MSLVRACTHVRYERQEETENQFLSPGLARTPERPTFSLLAAMLHTRNFLPNLAAPGGIRESREISMQELLVRALSLEVAGRLALVADALAGALLLRAERGDVSALATCCC